MNTTIETNTERQKRVFADRENFRSGKILSCAVLRHTFIAPNDGKDYQAEQIRVFEGYAGYAKEHKYWIETVYSKKMIELHPELHWVHVDTATGKNKAKVSKMIEVLRKSNWIES